MNIALIGMMGSGKTTVGKLLIQVLPNFSFVDTDEEIVHQEKCSINDIFKTKGEDYFREIETQILQKVLNSDNQIISTGGGIIKSTKNIELLKQKSFVVYLEAEAKTLFEHVKNNKERPLLNCEDVKEKIKVLLDERKALYEAAAHNKINIEEKQPCEIAQEIKDFYESKR